MSKTELAVIEGKSNGNGAALIDPDRQGAMEALIALERAGGITKVSLELSDPNLPLETWLAMGRLFGELSRTINWLLGDWIIFGEAAYGEGDSSQGFDDIQSRYNEAERVTGVDHGTMMNIASICRRVNRPQRMEPLGFWIHEEVAKLPSKEQTRWLKKSVKESWNRADLRRAIKVAENPEAAENEGNGGGPDGDGLTLGERLEAAARAIWATAEKREDGIFVPLEAWAMLEAVLKDD